MKGRKVNKCVPQSFPSVKGIRTALLLQEENKREMEKKYFKIDIFRKLSEKNFTVHIEVEFPVRNTTN